MKYALRIGFTMILIFTFFACSEDTIVDKQDETFLYTSEKINFTEIVNSKIGNNLKSSNDTEDYMHSEFETTFYIPENLSDDQLDTYINSNLTSINGTLKYVINDDVFLTISVINGEIGSTIVNKNIQFKTTYPCTYDGIQDCVQNAVYNEWSTFKKISCAVRMGLPCIAQETAICVAENC